MRRTTPVRQRVLFLPDMRLGEVPLMPSKEDYQKYLYYYRGESERIRRKELKEKYRAEGKCWCGRELLEGASSAKYCVVCIEGGKQRRQISRWR